MGRFAVLGLLAVATYLLWQPLVYPGGKAALVILDIYSEPLTGVNVARAITPEPRQHETRETFGGVEMRVSWWRPGWGDRHPAIMIVNGATPLGNDNAATRGFGVTLARAGYLVMLPEFPFSKEGRLDPDAPRVVDAAFAHLRALAETKDLRAGAFGASTGAALMLCAAGAHPALARADHLTVLGGYFDLDTYVAAVATRSTGAAPWEPSAEAKERIPPAVEVAMRTEGDRATVRRAFTATTYGGALETLASLSPPGRELFDRLSPSASWAAVTPPVFWIHDPNDTYEPLAEAHAAQAAPRSAPFRLIVPRLVQHAEVGEATKGQDPLALARELWGLLTFTLEVLRAAG